MIDGRHQEVNSTASIKFKQPVTQSRDSVSETFREHGRGAVRRRMHWVNSWLYLPTIQTQYMPWHSVRSSVGLSICMYVVCRTRDLCQNGQTYHQTFSPAGCPVILVSKICTFPPIGLLSYKIQTRYCAYTPWNPERIYQPRCLEWFFSWKFCWSGRPCDMDELVRFRNILSVRLVDIR